MWEGWMCQWLSIRPDGLPVRTLESLNARLGGGLLTLSCERGGLLLPHTGALGLVKYEWSGTVVRVRVTMDTVVIFSTDQRILVIEETVSSVTFGI